MSDFISLNCPSCGGKLSVQKDSPTYICEYCGTEHKLREEDIEFFGRCPKCHRNDRVEKITAIVNKHDQLAGKFPPPDQFNLDNFIKRTDLAIQQTLNSLETSQIQDNVYKKKGYYFFIGMGVLLIQTCCIFSLALGSTSDITWVIFFVSLVGSIVLAGFGVYYATKGERKQRDLETETQNRMSTLRKELLTQREEIKNQKSILTHKLKLRYDKMYYCHRDDLVFIPGEALYANCNDYKGYLTHILKTNKKP